MPPPRAILSTSGIEKLVLTSPPTYSVTQAFTVTPHSAVAMDMQIKAEHNIPRHTQKNLTHSYITESDSSSRIELKQGGWIGCYM